MHSILSTSVMLSIFAVGCATAVILTPATESHAVELADVVNVDALIPSITFCYVANCTIATPPTLGCARFTIDDRVQGSCYSTYGVSGALSVIIKQPNRGGLPTTSVFVRDSTCKGGAQVPRVNTCYNISPAATHWYVTSGNTVRHCSFMGHKLDLIMTII